MNDSYNIQYLFLLIIDNILLKNVKILNIYIFSKLVESGFVHVVGFYYTIFSFLFTSKRQYLKNNIDLSPAIGECSVVTCFLAYKINWLF